MDPQHHQHHQQPGMQQLYPDQGAAAFAGYPPGQYQQYPAPNGGASPATAYSATGAPAKPAASSGSSRTAIVILSICVAALVVAVIGLAAGLGVSQKSLHDSQTNLDAALASL
jgi:hypothetical protein